MKRRFSFIAVLAVFLISSCTIIQPGEVGIKVNRLGDSRGVQNFTAKTGLVFYMPGVSSVFSYPTFVQTATWQKHNDDDKNNEIIFNTKDGMVVSGDVSLSYQLDEAKVPAFYVKFRTDDLDVFTHGFLYNVARDAFNEVASLYTVEEIYGEKKEEYLQKVRSKVNSQILPYGVIIQQFGFLGKIRLPEQVANAINAKIQAIQDAIRTENEIRAAKAQAEKTIAAAEGTAKANTLLANSMTPQLIQWEQLQIQKILSNRWNGAYPMYMAGQAPMLMMNMK